MGWSNGIRIGDFKDDTLTIFHYRPQNGFSRRSHGGRNRDRRRRRFIHVAAA